MICSGGDGANARERKQNRRDKVKSGEGKDIVRVDRSCWPKQCRKSLMRR